MMRGWGLLLGVGVCLLVGQSAAAQTFTLSPSTTGPTVNNNIIASGTGTGVTVTVTSGGAVTLGNGVFANGSTSGTAIYNTATITATCAKSGNAHCDVSHNVTITNTSGNSGPGGSFTAFNVTLGTCVGDMSASCTTFGPVGGNGTSSVSIPIKGSGPNGWTATFTIGMTAQFNAIGGSGTGQSKLNYLISLN